MTVHSAEADLNKSVQNAERRTSCSCLQSGVVGVRGKRDRTVKAGGVGGGSMDLWISGDVGASCDFTCRVPCPGVVYEPGVREGGFT